MAVKLGLVAPYPDLAKLAREVCRELGEEVEIRQGDLRAGVSIAREFQDRGMEAIISRGGTALAIEDAVQIPVVTIKVTGFDILRAVSAARHHSNTIGVMGFRNIVYGSESIEDILDVSLAPIPLERGEDAESLIQKAVREGIRVIVGDAVSTRMTSQYGVTGILVQSGKEAIAKAIDEAKQVAAVRRYERQRAEQFKAILDFAYEGIVGIDQDGIIKVFNPVAERLLGLSASAVLGRRVSEILPGVGLDVVRTSGRSELGAVQRIGGTLIASNRVPITVSGEVVGAVFTFQDVTRIQQVEKEVRRELYLKGHVAKHTFRDLVSSSEAMNEVIGRARRFAATESTVLVTGETGTGKELLAQSIHSASRRSGGSFVAVNCAALPESLLESELFGYEEGAFTGTRKGGKPGLFELAHGGSIFLDEIGDMPLHIQARLLRVLEQREVMRLGGDKVLPVDVRVIAATHRGLQEAVQNGTFRADLYYRLNVLTVIIPPLRERPGDIQSLAESFIRAAAERNGIQTKALSPEAAAEMSRRSWPGNVRELRNACERLVVGVPRSTIMEEDVLQLLGPTGNTMAPGVSGERVSVPLEGGLKVMEEAIMREVLKRTAGDRSEASRILGISRSTLWRRLGGDD